MQFHSRDKKNKLDIHQQIIRLLYEEWRILKSQAQLHTGDLIIGLVQPAQNRRTETSDSKSRVSFSNSHLQNITESCQVSQLIGGR